ncbi:MAG: YrzE family protein [Oscillospiraceae bacterium]|nr:YrzE family protein [Oscillospiraceae bacterium]
MVKNRKVTGKAMSLPAGLGIGLIVSVTITIAAVGVLASLVLNGKVGENAIGAGAMVIVPLSVAVGALTAALAVKHRWLVVCAGVGGVYYATMLGITALFFGGQYSGMGTTALLTLLGIGVSAAVGLRGEKKRFKPMKKYRPR